MHFLLFCFEAEARENLRLLKKVFKLSITSKFLVVNVHTGSMVEFDSLFIPADILRLLHEIYHLHIFISHKGLIQRLSNKHYKSVIISHPIDLVFLLQPNPTKFSGSSVKIKQVFQVFNNQTFLNFIVLSKGERADCSLSSSLALVVFVN